MLQISANVFMCKMVTILGLPDGTIVGQIRKHNISETSNDYECLLLILSSGTVYDYT